MSSLVRQYTILISAPNDVDDQVEIVKKCFDKFNRGEGKRNNINLISRYWKDDIYPEQGNSPQKLINKQIVDGCDAIVAIFGVRFGTATENYGSGTEEEICRLGKNGKQIFLYFSDKMISPNGINIDQFSKVQEFKKKLQSKGLYDTYKTDDEFSEKLLRALSKYFIENLNINNKLNNTYDYIKFDTREIFSNKFFLAIVQQTLNENYIDFINIMIIKGNIIYDNENCIYSINGYVPGLHGIAEGIFQFKYNGDIYIFFTDGNVIKYYTNDDKLFGKIPKNKILEKWFASRNFEQFILFCSLPKEELKAMSGEFKSYSNHVNSTIKVNIKDENVEFEGKCNYGGHVGRVEAKVPLISNHLALYKDEMGNTLKFTFLKDRLLIDEKGHFGGIGATFKGEYRIEI